MSTQEQHFTIQQIAAKWQLSRRTVTRMFRDEPDVLVWGKTESRFRKPYLTMRVPESVMNRVYERHKKSATN